MTKSKYISISKKQIASLLCSTIFLTTSLAGAFAHTPETMQEKLIAVEERVYGMEQTGPLLDRVHNLEKDFAGNNKDDSLVKRIDKIYDIILVNENKPALITKLNAIEWGLTEEVSEEPVEKRISSLEAKVLGKSGEGAYNTRIKSLSKYAFGQENIPLVEASLPQNTLIKVELVTPVNAKKLKVGDMIEIKVKEDVIADGLLFFAKGAKGYGIVKDVSKSKNFGRDAKVEIDFQTLDAFDSTKVDITLGKEAKEKMKSMAMAAGASIAGMVVLGPVGIIAGAFVHGKNIDLPKGTELYIQTKHETLLYGLETLK